jgi:hypothetical protein
MNFQERMPQRGKQSAGSSGATRRIARAGYLIVNISLGMVAIDVGAPVLVQAQDGITVDDLVRRVQIPIAALSPDARFAAYLLMRANPVKDVYEMTIRVVDLLRASEPMTLQEYVLSPSETFNENAWLQPSAADLRWLSNDVLVYTASMGGKVRLVAWTPRDNQTRILLDGHDRIEADAADGTTDQLTFISTDSVDPPLNARSRVRDLAWLIRDNYRFYGPLKNPKSGRWVKAQRWLLASATGAVLTPVGAPTQAWESEPEEWTAWGPEDTVSTTITTPNHVTYAYDAARSPDGKLTAMVELRNANLRQPDASFSASRLVVKEGGRRRALIPFIRPNPLLTILGWSPNNRAVYYISVGPQESTLNLVSLTGQQREVFRAPAQIERPGAAYARECQAISRDGRFALLVRSTNIKPAELIKIDLRNGAVTVLDSPNDVFIRRQTPAVRFYQIGDGKGDVWGRLYLPLNYTEGRRYPLVITNYLSRPGYETGIGEEVPILPLVDNDIAVFAMHSLNLGYSSSTTGDFRVELSRVQRPLESMNWIYRKLVADGIVDSGRVGLTGLSYGAEIAMFAYWKSNIFRAVSATTASWDPTLYFFGGLSYASDLERRGFPPPDQAGIRRWREFAAGLNARPTLPPLLFQSPDDEEVFTVPTWFQLRRAGAPVEWYEYPHEGHVKRSPANKWWVFERNLDWFRFWLQDHQDPDPAKHEQYARWRHMREQQETMVKESSKIDP